LSTTILIIGLLVFFAHFLSLQFSRTNIPDVLVLMILGIVIGPLLGVVAADDFGKIGSLIATIALVVILYGGPIRQDRIQSSLSWSVRPTRSCMTLPHSC